ncbi:hypothetical protein KHA79_05705 [Xanthomonas translucens pv. cerealis]|nr:hypothetical protein KHA79_05705 [Xanthomonas translucens pv. cerealis]
MAGLDHHRIGEFVLGAVFQGQHAAQWLPSADSATARVRGRRTSPCRLRWGCRPAASGHFVFDAAEVAAMRRDLEQCVRLGCDGAVLGVLNPAGEVDMDTMRVLIAGAPATALDGIGTIAALLRQADGSIGVMPGADVSEQNVRALRVGTGARKFHASARSPVVAQVHAPHAYIRDLGGDYQRTDVAHVCRIVAAFV